jgi:hypothetical protein
LDSAEIRRNTGQAKKKTTSRPTPVEELAMTWLILVALAFVVFFVVEDFWKHLLAK